jgi:hypothetical protein
MSQGKVSKGIRFPTISEVVVRILINVRDAASKVAFQNWLLAATTWIYYVLGLKALVGVRLSAFCGSLLA